MCLSYKLITSLLVFAGGLFSCSADNPHLRLYQQKLRNYLQKDSTVAHHITLSEAGISLYASLADKQKQQAEFTLTWGQVPHFQRLLESNPSKAWALYDKANLANLTPTDTASGRSVPSNTTAEKPLAGYRIALDAGHLATNMQEARLEQRFIDIQVDKETKYSFFEADLAWATAMLLKKDLEKYGAEVLLTRPQHSPPKQAHFWQHWQNYKQKYLKSEVAQDTLLAFNRFFLQFKRQDFEIRATKINTFAPHLTLMIHYNVDSQNAPWDKPSPKNYNMAFVAGSFMGNELKDKKDRFQLLRLLLTKDIEKSIQLSHHVLTAFEQVLKVPTIPAENQLDYLQNYALLTERQGVYARNLTLCREVFGVLCYGESLYQDNAQEMRLLAQKTIKVESKYYTSERVQAVAQAYLQGVLAWVKARQSSPGVSR